MIRSLPHINVFVFFILTFFSCEGDKDYSPSEVVSFYSTNSPRKFITEQYGNLKFHLAFIPSESLAVKDMENTSNLEEFHANFENYKNLQYFNLLMSHVDSKRDVFDELTNSNYSMEELIQHFRIDLKNSIFLNACGKRSKPEIYHFERTYGISPYRSIMLGFSRENCDQYSLQVNDNFLKSKVNFEINKEYLEQYPRLK